MTSRSVARGLDLHKPRQQQHGAGIDLRPLEQPAQRDAGHRSDIGRLGHLERQAAKLRRGPPHLGNIFFLANFRSEKPGLTAPMRNFRRLRRKHIRFVDAGCQHGIVGTRTFADHTAGGIGKGRRKIVHKRHLRMADANDVARLQHVVAANSLGSHLRAVAAFQIAKNPTFLGKKDFGVGTAAALVFDDDLISGGTTDGDRLSWHEPKNVGPLRSFTNDQIR